MILDPEVLYSTHEKQQAYGVGKKLGSAFDDAIKGMFD